MCPTEKQLRAISIIEKNIPYIKFTGRTRAEASAFIADNLEKSKAQSRHKVKHVSSFRSGSQRYPSVKSNSRCEKTDYEKYEEYIRQISGAYDEAAGDDGWGGFGGRELARKLHPFDEWKWHR